MAPHLPAGAAAVGRLRRAAVGVAHQAQDVGAARQLFDLLDQPVGVVDELQVQRLIVDLVAVAVPAVGEGLLGSSSQVLRLFDQPAGLDGVVAVADTVDGALADLGGAEALPRLGVCHRTERKRGRSAVVGLGAVGAATRVASSSQGGEV
jgi:hypothetical protein